MKADINVTRKKENVVIRTALLVTALPFFAFGVTLLPVIGLAIGFALAGAALSPWQETPLRGIKVLIGGGRPEDSSPGGRQGRHNTIPVTVLSSSQTQGDESDFDASRIDVDTVRFGPRALKPLRNSNRREKAGSIQTELREAGTSDRVFYFAVDGTDRAEKNQTVCITGETTTGEAFRGCGKLAA